MHKFRDFYNRHCRTVFRLLKKSRVREAIRDDIAQEVWIKIARNLDTANPAHEVGWLDRICRGEIANHYSRSAHRYETPEPDVGTDIPDQVDLQELYARRELDQLVHRVLDAMDKDLVEVLVRHELTDQSVSEIANELGIRWNTAKARLDKAHAVFRAKMQRLLEPEKPAHRPWLAALPFGLSGLYPSTGDDDPAEYQRFKRDVWNRVAHQLGLDEEPPVSEPPESGKRRMAAPTEPSPSAEAAPSAVPAPKSHDGALAKNPLTWTFLFAVPSIIAALHIERDAVVPLQHLRPFVVTVVVQVDGGGGALPNGTQPPVHAASSPVGQVPGVAFNGRGSASGAGGAVFAAFDPERTGLELIRRKIDEGRFAEALADLAAHERRYLDSQYAGIRQSYAAKAKSGLARLEQANDDVKAPR
jgi:RNA polymerase sigma factor (sigma-70 family)